MKVTFIATVYNEEKTIEPFVESILKQTKMPDEIIIVDGGSSDMTLNVIARSLKTKQSIQSLKNHLRLLHFVRKDGGKVEIKVLTKKGNRAVGRNEAIKNATGEIIVCTDAGNLIDKDWVKNITEPFKGLDSRLHENDKVDVVAGYYKAITQNVFQKCVVPYAFVMPDKVDPHNFLPATRSVAFTKKIWEQVGGFNEKLSHNEDYAFAKSLQKAKAKIVFKKDAIVYWFPRNSLRQTYIMLIRFAYGDAEARIWRPKVMFLFIRYFIAILLFLSAILFKSTVLLSVLILFFFVYLLWAVIKNYKYVNEWQAIFILPTLQLVADWAVVRGTLLGFFNQELHY